MRIRSRGKDRRVRQLICEGINAEWIKVDSDLIDPLISSVTEALGDRSATAEAVAGALVAEVKAVRDSIDDLRVAHEAFNRRHAVIVDPLDSRDNILAYAAELGAEGKQLREDKKAFRRYFGHDAVESRFQSRHGDLQRQLAFVLERLGSVAGRAMMAGNSSEATWRMLDLESLIAPLLEFEGDARVAASAFRCLSTALVGVEEELRHDILSAKAVQVIYRLSLDVEADVWIQCEALALLREISRSSFDEVARIRLQNPPSGDDMFVRRRLVPLVVSRSGLENLLLETADDLSPFVRQGLAESLPYMSQELVESLLQKLACEDPEAAVRASAVLQIQTLVCHSERSDLNFLGRLMSDVLGAEKDEYVLRVAIHVSAETHEKIGLEGQAIWRDHVLKVLEDVHRNAESIPVRRWAAQARERIWCDAEPKRKELCDRIAGKIRDVRPGASISLKDEVAASMDDASLGRILSVASQDDFGLDVKRSRRGVRLTRGHQFGFRIWRFLHELRNPSPDKRQAHRHTIGRIFEGDLRIPSPTLAEMSETKVPGEPLNISEEAGWRPFVPLVDEVISSLDMNSSKKPLRIVTSEGVTTVAPPKGPHKKAAARTSLNRKFEEFAKLRNSEPGEYISRLRGLGFTCDFEAHEDCGEDPIAAGPFTQCATPMLALGGADWFGRMREYFYSVYENTIGQLFVFLAGVAAFFVGRHLYLNQQFKKLRKRIPLVVGGWGTRGKSGTERIKAALFNAMGQRLVSKTTGCEAMFLYAPSFGKLQELFLFRPYDKATIWEQVNMVNLSARMRSRVFLWECMGLTPAYIEVLQRQWMQDDLSTIVNTYPDHEDLQGPAGIDIPQVMTYFLRQDGHCLTSEQQMTPILEEAAGRMNCKMDKVGWIEPGLLTSDILERFPYAEHPNNIALVAEMGAQLGVERDFSLKEMADRVVPDLGVLKVYPVAELAGRRLQFVNGFSANERFGALGNWERLGFDGQDPIEESGVWISAVVNNRADRVARSRVFASVVAKDIAVDRLFVIGTNLKGMVGYIKEAFDEYAQTLSLASDGEKSAEEVLRDTTHRFRLPASEAELSQMVDAIQGEEDLSTWREPYEAAYSEYRAFCDKLSQASKAEELDGEFRQLLWKWYERKIVVIWDQFSTGDQTINRIAQETPPGYENRIMGLQNIKGTGLDFVYRWQAWDQCYNACEQAVDRRPKVAREGMAALSAFKDYGLLCEEKVSDTLSNLSDKINSGSAVSRDQLNLVGQNMATAMQTVNAGLGSGDEGKGAIGKLRGGFLRFFEGFLDAGDAIRRRKKANQIYRDMENERISPARAAQEIQKLNKRQKGGWLEGDLARNKALRRKRRSKSSLSRRQSRKPERIVGVASPALGGS